MDRITSINPARILWCCDDQGITPEVLAQQAGISAARLQAVLHDGGALTIHQLRKVASCLGRGMLFFLDPGPVQQARVHSAQFRTLSRQKPDLSPRLRQLIERAERQWEVFLSLRETLGLDDLPRFLPPALDRQDLDWSAQQVRQWLGLDLNQTQNFGKYRQAVEAKGILVFRPHGYPGSWQIAKGNPVVGFVLNDPACPLIVVNKISSEAPQCFTLMHELAHVLLHRSSRIDAPEDLMSPVLEEREANALAGRVLVPVATLNQIDDRQRPHDVTQFGTWLRPWAHHLGVGVEVILRRLMDLGRLPPAAYAAYHQWVSAWPSSPAQAAPRLYRYREPIHLFGERFVRVVLGALSAQHITLAKATGYLDGLTLEHLHALERHCART